MNLDQFNPSGVSIVFITGFAVQQLLQIVDPLVSSAIANYRASRPRTIKRPVNNSDLKRSIMAALSFLLGLAVAILTKFRLLNPKELWDIGDLVVTALVIGSGTEAGNTTLKFFSYLKDQQNPSKPEPAIPASATAFLSSNALVPRALHTFARDVMDITGVTLSVLQDWAGVAVTDQSVELCVLLASGPRHIPCDENSLQALIVSLRKALKGASDLSSLRPNDLMGSGQIKTVNALLDFIFFNTSR